MIKLRLHNRKDITTLTSVEKNHLMIEEIRNLLSKAETEKAIELAIQYGSKNNSPNVDELSILSSRLHKWNNDIQLGIEDSSKELHKINYAILKILSNWDAGIDENVLGLAEFRKTKCRLIINREKESGNFFFGKPFYRNPLNDTPIQISVNGKKVSQIEGGGRKIIMVDNGTIKLAFECHYSIYVASSRRGNMEDFVEKSIPISLDISDGETINYDVKMKGGISGFFKLVYSRR